ncbi:T6SS immunity protein Tli4 family protein [Iodobacter ciconiae]|uniref:Tle cognate immunity protein 4 C-terminal domain-containing protein n=1 Tax=Iodobacter ciconiae TaxID=2496266 RepID=A0A3S8ZP98_9NEIS|nr:T6SS immunity protein Tli4 family protein [Iodobacter ciconiae]AZN35282.1 hypothetical protein EJO50_01520 [Iodobacter ciconiae]
MKKRSLQKATIVITSLFALIANTYAAEQTMFEKTKTYCFGRYLVNMPAEVELKNFGNKYYATIIELGTGREAFKKAITEKTELLKNETWKGGFKYSSSEFDGNEDQRILISKANLYGDIAYGIDTFKIMPSNKPGAGRYFYTSGKGYDDIRINEIISQYKLFLSQVRYRPQNEIPKEPGFCFENGFVANDGKTPQVEAASLYFVLKNHPYVKIRISSDVYFKQYKTLLERIDESGIRKQFLNKIKTVKKGPREVNSLKGEESLNIAPSDDETGVIHAFVWETLGEVGNPLLPSIHLEVNTGEAGAGQHFPSTLSNQEAIALYEAIVKTIRIRPIN